MEPHWLSNVRVCVCVQVRAITASKWREDRNKQEKNAIQIICDTISTNCTRKKEPYIANAAPSQSRNMLEWRNNVHCIFLFLLSFFRYYMQIYIAQKFFHVCASVSGIQSGNLYIIFLPILFLFHLIWIFSMPLCIFLLPHEPNQWKIDFICIVPRNIEEKYS